MLCNSTKTSQNRTSSVAQVPAYNVSAMLNYASDIYGILVKHRREKHPCQCYPKICREFPMRGKEKHDGNQFLPLPQLDQLLACPSRPQTEAYDRTTTPNPNLLVRTS